MSIKSNLVRAAFAALCLSTFVGAAPQPAQADPYQWCAEYGGRGGGRNCYFLTFNQCRAAIPGSAAPARRTILHRPADRHAGRHLRGARAAAGDLLLSEVS